MLHSVGRMAAAEKTFVPEMEYPSVYYRERVYVAIYAMVIGLVDLKLEKTYDGLLFLADATRNYSSCTATITLISR